MADVDTTDLEGLDPFALMAAESERIDRYYAGLDAAALARPSASAGWTVQDVLAHLAGSEEYNRACLDDDVSSLFSRSAERGVTDVNSFNQLGVADRRGHAAAEVLAEWRVATSANREGLQALDGGTVPTSVGPYPARWQAFHLAAELATHADDVGVPTDASEAAGRTAWRARVARFMLREAKPELNLADAPGGTRVWGAGLDAVLDGPTLVALTQARRPPARVDPPLDPPLDPAVAAALSLMP